MIETGKAISAQIEANADEEKYEQKLRKYTHHAHFLT